MGGSTTVAKYTCAVLVIFIVAVVLPVNAVTHRKILSSGSAELPSSKTVPNVPLPPISPRPSVPLPPISPILPPIPPIPRPIPPLLPAPPYPAFPSFQFRWRTRK
ncbi:hypothetical protein Nepgr_028761 [Nepenthes gracilis]|uniref:Uncharacterized protein n=1 Tax=Nepenthes gracilis TaxID=150966 RepID=A0AAD3TCX1_NEPGR|nr:hypothetical protein Nepgr_028761 [Nepenthes gracilis]